MFQNLEKPVIDAIISLMAEIRADSRPDIIDLSVGVYKDENGDTPVMQAVRRAEQRLMEQQTTKAYIGLAGDAVFNSQIADLVLECGENQNRIATAQTPGGSGALRLLAELIRRDAPETTLWLSEPTWANHYPLLGTVGLECQSYPYFDASTQSIRFEEMCGAVDRMSRDDVIVLHGCCHNPTGTDLSLEQWRHLGRLLTERGVVPLIDLAYAGLGDGLDKDLAGTRAIVSMASVTMIAVSCSKNFGVYRDRVGCSIVSTDSSETAESLRGHLGAVARTLYSMPPDHGAAVIRTILADGVLRSLWNEELTVMQHRVSGLRSQLANRLNQLSGTDRWDFIAGQKGMFSLLGTSDEAVAELKQKHGIYIVKGGRLNIAGLREADIDRVARALIDIEH